MLEKCSLLDDMPLAFCVIELVFNKDGRGVDFIFRYCNAEMANVEGVPVEEMLDRSFYEVFLTIHCYQPKPGYCACVLQVTDR